ncbi:hypothetical protein MITSMUL_05379 [Mitsuokella multacida DSM 20544]|uniref:Uncharacterized protein n=1 Tax=Mitsuokella multacida DSM 20544 TaxID=500635 RepID=C9KQ64_9FIRM|nr:hypothetical protein MITSMUL_05379 [Mitsuokella multacida DSM 20544]
MNNNSFVDFIIADWPDKASTSRENARKIFYFPVDKRASHPYNI